MTNFARKSKALFISLLCTVSFLIAPLAIVGCSSGCKSTTTNTYKASGVTHVAATAALRGWNEYLGKAYAEAAANTDTNKAVKARIEILAKEQQVKAAWEKYQAAQLTLLTVTQEFAKTDPKAPPDPTAWDRVTHAAIAASVAAADIIALLEKLGVKIQ